MGFDGILRDDLIPLLPDGAQILEIQCAGTEGSTEEIQKTERKIDMEGQRCWVVVRGEMMTFVDTRKTSIRSEFSFDLKQMPPRLDMSFSP
jgi:hypothetical protein